MVFVKNELVYKNSLQFDIYTMLKSVQRLIKSFLRQIAA